MTPSCETCRFYDPGEAGHGACRANPPQVSAIVEASPEPPDRIMPVTMWPMVAASDWCGRWSAAGIETKVHPLDQGKL